MNGLLKDGDLCLVSRDIVIGGVVAFKKGETVKIERIQPNQQRPDYKYVVYSSSLERRFQLSDAELETATDEMPAITIMCNNCNKEFETSYAFCPYCGTSKTASETAEVTSSMTTPVSSEGFPQHPKPQDVRGIQAQGVAATRIKTSMPVAKQRARRTLGEWWGDQTGGKKFAIVGIAAFIVVVIIVAGVSSNSGNNTEKIASTTRETTVDDDTDTTTIKTSGDFLQIDNVSNGQELAVGPAILVGTVKEKNCTITCNGQPIVIDPNTSQFSQTIDIVEGSNAVTFAIADDDGKTYEMALAFTGVISPETYRAVSPPLPSYKELEKNADAFAGTRCKLHGQVVQAMVSGDITSLRVDVTPMGYGYWTDTIYVTLKGSTPAVEGSMVWVYGTITGSYTYESQAGWNITLPAVEAKYVDIAG